jgi:hypothetical protein
VQWKGRQKDEGQAEKRRERDRKGGEEMGRK